jgi:TolB protein
MPARNGRERVLQYRVTAAAICLTLIAFSVTFDRPPASATAPGANGLIAFQNWVGTSVQIYTIGVDGSNPKNISSNPFHDFGPAWSPDGRRIAFASDRDWGPGMRDIYVMNADGSNPRRVTTNAGDDVDVAWSPDGSSIAFVSYRDGDPEIYLVSADGTGEARLTNSPGQDVTPDFSPDGKYIAFTSDRSGTLQIHLMTTTPDHTVTALAPSSSYQYMPSWSPDGAKVAFTSSPQGGAGGMGMFVASLAGGPVQLLTDFPAHEATWSPDGAQIAFSGRKEGQQIWVMDSDGTNKHPVTTPEQGLQPMVPDWQPLKPPAIIPGPPVVSAWGVYVGGAATPADDEVTIQSISWDWGDGTVDEGWFPRGHVYLQPDRY